MTEITDIAANLNRVRELITRAARTAGRNPEEIALVAVSKYSTADAVRAAYAAGHRFFGESRIQDCQEKIRELRSELPDAVWCLIGHLQTNKVKRALELFDEIHSVDSLKLATELSRRCSESGRELPILLQINSSGETQKYGVTPERALETATHIAEMPALRLKGLMTMGPLTDDQSAIRDAFHTTRKLYDRLQRAGVFSAAPGRSPELSMGMSDDFALGIAEGSTMVRIGTAIFAPRLDD